MSKTEKIYKEYLQRTGGRDTQQKRTIITELSKLRSHFDIEDFISDIRKKDSKGSRATVYRVMKELLKEGFIQKITTKDGKVFMSTTSRANITIISFVTHVEKFLKLKVTPLKTTLMNIVKHWNSNLNTVHYIFMEHVKTVLVKFTIHQF